MEDKNKLVVFQDKKIRRVWFKEQWYFSIVDIVEVLTDSINPTDYLKKLRKRDLEFGSYIGTNCPQVDMPTSSDKLRNTLAGNTKDIFRIIQSIPSRKAEPFKQWLSQVGYERIEEIENPELGQDRIKKYYELKDYPKDWIDKRLRGIAIRQELTDEWKNRDIKSENEFAILTNEITKATFGKTVGEYKEFKQLQKKNQNLRDHMTDWELILTMIGEKATKDITQERNSQGFVECKDSAIKGGSIAKRTRQDIEENLGKSVVSKENFLPKQKEKKKLN
ncbi:MAG: Bro-N domain-containing protein [Nanoarchaeota archaeon]|nr:Bro-N domain-containing protein [Nanoarchaeota archaeon]MBU1269813.1 Bro-N domain-containing protein [Nanoarchaeota archaeon]MBU1604284.1 Bro-N domain-containing protein [Nanoarchaeota archaeon]MBU2442442.1 Bro-N domain-containing protein [Nanoarchaeota archaeon]